MGNIFSKDKIKTKSSKVSNFLKKGFEVAKERRAERALIEKRERQRRQRLQMEIDAKVRKAEKKARIKEEVRLARQRVKLEVQAKHLPKKKKDLLISDKEFLKGIIE